MPTSPITPELLAQLSTWEGRTEVARDTLTPAPMVSLAAALDLDLAEPREGDVLPPLWHWLYFLPRTRQSEIGEDGHPKLGAFLPPVPLPRRMWAGGRLTWHGALRMGDRVQRTSTIASVTHKTGRSGDLVFVVVRHELSSGHGVLLTEEQDLVYRALPRPGDGPAAGARPPAEADFGRKVTPDPVLLFRYSAVTFNGHRIHYDRPYAANDEGYAGLVVHGPLQATLLMDLASRAAPGREVATFSFRAVRPLTDLGPFRVCGQHRADSPGPRLWTQDQCERVTMEAELQFR